MAGAFIVRFSSASEDGAVIGVVYMMHAEAATVGGP